MENFSAAFMKLASGVTGVAHGAEFTDYENHAFLLSGSTGVIDMHGEQVRLFGRTPETWSQRLRVAGAGGDPGRAAGAGLDLLHRPRRAPGRSGRHGVRSDGRVGRRSLEMIKGSTNRSSTAPAR